MFSSTSFAPKIILTGSLAYDYILNFHGKFTDHILPDKIHTINLSFYAERLSKTMGGITGNIGYNLSLLGARPIILGSLGEKDGREYINHLKKYGLETKYIKLIKNEYTASSILITDLLNNQIGSFYPGAMKEDKKRSLKEIFSLSHPEIAAPATEGSRSPKATASLDSSTRLIGGLGMITMVVISPGDPQAMENFIKECQKNNIPYLFDPGKQLPYLSDDLLKLGISKCQILIANDYEMALMRRRLKIIQFSHMRHLDKILITTFGEKGSQIEVSGQIFKIKAAKAKKILDPVGAGDGFLGGFLAGYVCGFDLQTCGQMGSVAAVYTVEKYGTQTHCFTKRDFIKRYKSNYGEEIKL